MTSREKEFRSYVKNFPLANALVLAQTDFLYSDFFTENELNSLLMELREIQKTHNIFNREVFKMVIGAKALKNEKEAKQLLILLALITDPNLSKSSEFYLLITRQKSLLSGFFTPDISFFTSTLQKGGTFVKEVVLPTANDIINGIKNPLKPVFKWSGTYLILGLAFGYVMFRKKIL